LFDWRGERSPMMERGKRRIRWFGLFARLECVGSCRIVLALWSDGVGNFGCCQKKICVV
jgi:hypothetical protein